ASSRSARAACASRKFDFFECVSPPCGLVGPCEHAQLSPLRFTCYTPRGLFRGKFMHKKLFLLLILFVLPAAAQTIAIRAGNLLDPAKGTVSKDQIILVENGKITAVGAGLSIPKDAQVVDLSKEWVMPGLIDAHTHLTLV